MIPEVADVGVPINPAMRQWMQSVSRAVGKTGSATLVGGTVVVSEPTAGTGSLVFVSRMTTGGTAGHLSVVRAKGSFTINSSSGTDTSTVAWMVL